MKKLAIIFVTLLSCANAAEVLPDDPKLLQSLVDQGNVEAMTKLGLFYFTGNQVEKSNGKALALYSQAAEKGDLLAMNNLCNMYLYGYGVERNLQLALQLCSKPARAGFASSMVMIAEIAQQIEEGPLAEDKKLADEFAFRFYKMAAERGHPHGQFMLGHFLETGRGTAVNIVEAKEWYMKAASQGDKDAREAVGRMYKNTQ